MARQSGSDNAETILDGLHAGDRPAPAPERIGPYRVESRLGAGGMGEVFLAWDERLERQVAIKRIRQETGLSPEQRERFRREARLVARLSHSAVVQIHDLISDGPDDAIVMEYVEGRTLADRLASERLATAEVLRLACEIAEGLAAAHDAGLVHRDLKAANVLVTPSGHAKILDFGLARPVNRASGDPGLSRQGIVLGTCHAMSPEQARGEEVDERSDLFSFGALVHEMLTGRPPFRGKDCIDSLRKVATEKPVDPRLARPDLPAETAHLLRRLLAKNRDERPKSAQEVIDVLERLQTAPSAPPEVAPEESVGDFPTDEATVRELPVRPHRDPPPAPARKPSAWTRRSSLLVGAATLLVLTGVVALLLAVSPAPRLGVRNDDDKSFVDIQERVDAGEARREDLARLEEIIGTRPGFLPARVLAARIAYGLFAAQRQPADLEHASELVDEATKLFPQEPGPLRQAFRIALIGNRIEEAETILEKLEWLAPEDPATLPLRAALAERRGRTDEAESLLTEAVEQDPSWQNRCRLIDFEARHGRLDEARRQVDKAFQQDPGNLRVRERLGDLELRYGDLDQAERIYRELVRSVPERAYGNLATVLELRGRSREAADFYRRALEAQPDRFTTLINLAEIEKELGNERQAEELYRRALSRLEEIQDAAGLSISEAMSKAQCLARIGRTREAVEIAQRRSGKDPDNPYLLLQSALIYSLDGDRAAALAAAQAALDKGLPQRWFASPAFRWLRESPELRSRFRLEPTSL